MMFIERHGIPPVGAGLSLSHVLHFQLDEPDVHARTTAYLEVMEFVGARLTGVIAANQCTAFTSQLIDNRVLGATEYDPELVAASGVDVDKLPPLRPMDEPLGPVLPAVAAELGIPAGAIVHAAINDSHAGAIATGARDDARIGLMIGTTSVMLDTTEKHGTDLDHEVLSMPSPFPGEYLVWAENGLSGKVVEHVLERMVHASDELADHSTTDPFAAARHRARRGRARERQRPVPAVALRLALAHRRRQRARRVRRPVARHRAAAPRPRRHRGREPQPRVAPPRGGGVLRPPRRRDRLRRRRGPLARSGCRRSPTSSTGPSHRCATRTRPSPAPPRSTRCTAAGCSPTPTSPGMVDTTGLVEPRAEHRATYERLQTQFVAAFEALRPISAALNA